MKLNEMPIGTALILKKNKDNGTFNNSIKEGELFVEIRTSSTSWSERKLAKQPKLCSDKKTTRGYYPIFSVATVLISCFMGMSAGMLLIELSLRKTALGTIFFIPLFILFTYLLIRDEKAYMGS